MNREQAKEIDVTTWSVVETAARMNLPVKSVYKLLGSGEIPSLRFGRSVRVAPRDVASFLERCRRDVRAAS